MTTKAKGSASDGGGRGTGLTAGMMLGLAVCLLALPSAVLAFTTSFAPAQPAAGAAGTHAEGQPGDAGGLARAMPFRSLAKGQLFPFTPAGTPNRPDRSVTVAVRVDPETARTIRVEGARLPRIAEVGLVPLRIAPTAFSLGVSRGYQNFAQTLVPPPETRKIDMPDLSRFSVAPGSSTDDRRFNPRIVIDENRVAGRAPRTFAADEDQVDVGGSYRLTRNLDVTAGVRYSQERERLRPLTDGKQDSQAVYLGTQFRF